ncbi:hypothetical protein Q5752_003627 [Cryptotrichosporon argae]
MLRFVLAVLALMSLLATARPLVAETNAERFRRGLPPAAPKRLSEPTRTGAPLSRRSGAATVLQYAQAYRVGSSTPLGYLTFTGTNGYTVSTASKIGFTFTPAMTNTDLSMTIPGYSQVYYASVWVENGDDLSAGSGQAAARPGWYN